MRSYYQQPINCKIVLFFKKINSKDIGISKLASQLKLLPNLFELKDNGAVVMSTIIKILQDITRLLLLSQATNAASDGIFSALNCVKTYLRSKLGNNRLHSLMLVHVHTNILHNINLTDVANQFVHRKDRRKQTFRHLSQNYLLQL